MMTNREAYAELQRLKKLDSYLDFHDLRIEIGETEDEYEIYYPESYDGDYIVGWGSSWEEAFEKMRQEQLRKLML